MAQASPAKKGGEAPSSRNGHAVPPSEDQQMDVTEFFGRLQPFIEKLMDIYSQLAPYFHEFIVSSMKIYKTKIKPMTSEYRVDEISNFILGVVLLFFGGNFAMTIACYTALQLSGWPTVVSSYRKIRDNYEAAQEAFAKDKDAQSVFDIDNDGKITAKEVKNAAERWLHGTKEEKLEILSNFRNVLIAIDPQEVMNGLTGLWSVFVTVLATLRSSLAKDIALGVSLGNTLLVSLSRHIKPLIISNMKIEEEMKPWLDFIIENICKLIGISIALILVRVVSAFHSAIKGGSIIATYVFQFLNKQGLAPNTSTVKSNQDASGNIESTQFFIVVQYALAMYGFYYQLSNGFALNNILLRLVLFPFVMFETILTLLAAY